MQYEEFQYVALCQSMTKMIIEPTYLVSFSSVPLYHGKTAKIFQDIIPYTIPLSPVVSGTKVVCFLQFPIDYGDESRFTCDLVSKPSVEILCI